MLASYLIASQLCLGTLPAAIPEKPNFVILFADDLGYGDLQCYGHPTIKTPNLDRMASEGMRFTQFYSAACVCTPSRAALMTGRLPIRSGMCSDSHRVLFPRSTGGLQDYEVTLAQALKERGYATACVGKWHLGHHPQYLPTRHGFDEYFGIPYSNDMKPSPLFENETVIEEPAVQETLTRRYTERAVDFIKRNQKDPFLLYLPYTFPHVPLFASDKFLDTSLRGLYGDVVEELDWSVGQILDTLKSLGLSENTFVFFTSDNGPWLSCKLRGGSAGLLRQGKGTTFEGGMREPGIAWWPNTIPAGTVCRELGATMDLYTTCISLAGGQIPTDRIVDGQDLTPVLTGKGHSPRQTMFYYRGTRLMAVRKGPWKAHFVTQGSYGSETREPVEHDPPLLYQLEYDPSETVDVAKENPEVLADLMKEVQAHRAKLIARPSQLDNMAPKKK